MRRMSWVSFVSGLIIGSGVVVSSAYAGAPPKAPPAAVVKARDLCTRTNPPKTGRSTKLVEGANAYLGRLELDPGAQVPEHRDETEEYIHVIQGHGKIFIDDVAHELAPGDTVLMPANAKVRYENGPVAMVALQVFAGPGPGRKFAAWSGCEALAR